MREGRVGWTSTFYLIVGAVFYHYVEGWSVLDCVYFSMVVITTVGYGDFVPKTPIGKAFTIAFAFYGIMAIGVAIGRLATSFVERQKLIAKDASRRLLHVDMSTNPKETIKRQRVNEPKVFWWSTSTKIILKAMIPIWCALCTGLFIGYVEGWSVLDTFYYTTISITTIGFGDFSPLSDTGKIVAIVYLPFSVIAVAHAIGSILEEFSRRAVFQQVGGVCIQCMRHLLLTHRYDHWIENQCHGFTPYGHRWGRASVEIRICELYVGETGQGRTR